MDSTFETLVESYLQNNIGITNQFITNELLASLTKNLLAHVHNKHMKHAGTGNEATSIQNKLFRSDMIYWLDKSHDDIYENLFFKQMDAFVLYLNQSCYTGITDYEFHYTLYEKGSFYKRHLDQFKNNDSRKFSMILYLNENWKKEDGGELCIYQHGNQQLIAPENGKSVFFKSNQLSHEVLITHKPRMSITGWLKVSN
jgi:SM-20-related protein